MIRLDCVDTRIELRRDGALMLASACDSDVVAVLEELGAHEPAPLVARVRQWGAAEVHEPGTILLRT
jgi:hypothetical protein